MRHIGLSSTALEAERPAAEYFRAGLSSALRRGSRHFRASELRPHDASPIDISESDVRVLAGDAFDPATVRIERGLVASLVTITTTGLEWEATWLKEREHRPHVHLPWTDVADISVRKTAGLLSPALFELSLQTGQTVSFVGRHYRDAENAVAAIKPTLA